MPGAAREIQQQTLSCFLGFISKWGHKQQSHQQEKGIVSLGVELCQRKFTPSRPKPGTSECGLTRKQGL